MKKLLIAFCLCLAFVLPCMAAQEVRTIVANQILDDDPVDYSSGIIDLRRFRRVGFWFIYDETEDGGGVSANVSLIYSSTATVGDNASSGYFFDFAGGGTLQQTESVAADGEYFFWVPVEISIPFVQIFVDGIATDSNDTIDFSIILVGQI